MSDLISRQAAIDVIGKIFPVDPMRNDYTQGITCGAALATEYIKQMPSAEPKWISVSERLPDTYTDVLVSDGKYVWIDSLEDDFNENGNYVVWWDSSNSVDFDKTAWMPLPEPYREVKE